MFVIYYMLYNTMNYWGGRSEWLVVCLGFESLTLVTQTHILWLLSQPWPTW